MTKARKNVVASVLARLRNVAQEAGLSLNDIDLTEFLMPAAKAAATSVEYPVRWEPLGPWQHERSSKI